ncbi:TlpA family protein disulfide reductase [Sphingobacterium faecale]|uniref:TlpA family protein disulfide reductase n=1 Tax=Sphingobacterium faecale TaxID=2803775 RepID=A0ABS1QXN3_9SPHI|nr:TlpA disulfide reductase family protein [Sphingobacterium faecale]MBL1407195.1 TlpA family protein disulfide reductase [Sphingobacterium faecale]
MKKIVLAVFLLFGIALQAQEQPYSSNVFPIQPAKVGHPLRILYDAKGGDLEFSDEVSVAVYRFHQDIWKVEQFSMKSVGNKQWEYLYPVSDSTLFVGVKFFQGDLYSPDIVDNNKNKGYGLRISDHKRKAQKGSYLAEASFIVPTLAKGAIINYYDEKLTLDKSYLSSIVKEEEKLSGKTISSKYKLYLGAQRLLLNDQELTPVAEKVVDQLLSNRSISADDLGDMQLFLQHQIKQDRLAEQVGKRITEQYPKSSTARFVAYSNIRTAGSLQDVIASYEEFLKKYPISEWYENPDNKGFIYYAVYRGIGSAYFDNKQFDKFQALFKDIDFRTSNELLRWNVMRAYMFNTVGKDSLYHIAEPLIQMLISKKGDGSYRSDFMNKQAADSNMNNQMDDRLFTHISLLNDLGRYEEARRYFLELSDKGKYGNAELNDINLNVLEKLGAQNEILPLLEMSIKANSVTPRMFDVVKSLYQKSHSGSLEGYDLYLAGLQSVEQRAELEAYVNEHLNVNYPIPDFSMENADGGYIDQDNIKDKIVVMDFWATWCRPCIMAFPGMQLLVDKYANDPQVAIYMVGTMQTGDYRTKSVNFVRGEGYRFTLLHDAENEVNGQQDKLFKSLVTPIFKDSSIPRKIVVKNGVIRYSSGGYSGSPSKLMDELSLVIEKLKSE